MTSLKLDLLTEEESKMTTRINPFAEQDGKDSRLNRGLYGFTQPRTDADKIRLTQLAPDPREYFTPPSEDTVAQAERAMVARQRNMWKKVEESEAEKLADEAARAKMRRAMVAAQIMEMEDEDEDPELRAARVAMIERNQNAWRNR